MTLPTGVENTNLINSEDRELLTTFFKQRIVPLSEDLSIKETYAQRRADRDSFFVKRHSPSMTRVEFELDLKDRDAFAATLETHWQNRPLQPVAQDLITLGTRFEQLDEKVDLSEFVYEMF